MKTFRDYFLVIIIGALTGVAGGLAINIFRQMRAMEKMHLSLPQAPDFKLRGVR